MEGKKKKNSTTVSNVLLCCPLGIDMGKNSHLEQLVEVLAEVLHEVHVGKAGQYQVPGLLGEGHFSLGEPGPVEGI